jgi:hypothetical protein
MLKRLKFEIDTLVTEMLDKIPVEMWVSETTTFLDPAMGGGQFIRAIIERLRQYGHSDENIRDRVFGIENNQLRVNFAVNKYSLIGTYISTDFLSWETDMKFDVIVGNPPYQKNSGAATSTPLWGQFVKKSFELSAPGGVVSLVHPTGWRNVSGNFEYVKDIINNNNLIYLSVNDFEMGQKTFGVGTAYDWYLVKNESVECTNTTIDFMDGKIEDVNVKELPFIPFGKFREIQSLMSDDNDNRVEILANSSYHTQRDHMSVTPSPENRYPCIYSITKKDGMKFRYSNIDSLGHFGTPKLIWSNGLGTYPVVDTIGEYGLTEFSYAIVDTPENLVKIKEAMETKEFIKLMNFCKFTNNKYAHKIIATFRKDFWKEFA